MNLSDKAADAATGLCGLATLAGCTITQLNEYLQAGAFLVAMVSGLCAAAYYVKKSLGE